MVSKVVILSAAFAAFAATVGATAVTSLIVDIAEEAESVGDCSAEVTFDDGSPTVELQGCFTDSNGITVSTALGDVTVSCNVNGGGVNGENQCASQRVVCRSGCCATINLQDSDAACSIPNFCTDGGCVECVEETGINLPVDLQC